MMNLSDVTRAAQELLKTNINLDKFDVTRNDYVNEDPALEKWLGIYKGDITYTPQTLGRGALNFKTTFSIKVVVQSYGAVEVTDIDTLLEERIAFIMNAFNTDLTKIDGTIDMIVGYDVKYMFTEDDDRTMPFQNALITISMEKRA